jgi:uncharacterized protein (DUF1778 family)
MTGTSRSGEWGWKGALFIRIDNAYTINDTFDMPADHPFDDTLIPPSGTKGSINLRIGSEVRRLIDDAAALLGKTRTEFMIDSARKTAIDTLLEQRLFALSPDKFDAFAKALDNPPKTGPKLKALLRRTKAWEK